MFDNINKLYNLLYNLIDRKITMIAIVHIEVIGCLNNAKMCITTSVSTIIFKIR